MSSCASKVGSSILLLVSLCSVHLVSVADATAATGPYEVDLQRPACDSSASEVKIIEDASDLSALDDPNYRVFCIRPGDYTSAGDVTVTADGEKGRPRYLVYDAPGGPEPSSTHPAGMASNQRAVLRGLVFDDADWWVVQGLFIDGGERLSPSGDGVTFLDGSSNNVLDRLVVQHGKGTLVQIEHASSSNVVQNSVVRETDSRASEPSKDFHCFHLKGDKPGTRDNRIVRNEIYDCAGDSIHFSGCPYWLPDAYQRGYDCSWQGEKSSRFAGDTRGTIIWGNDMYWTDDFRQVCGGGCGCYENAIDMKSTMGSTDRSSITSEDWVRIERNRIWDECDGGVSAIIAHFANADYVLLRHNVIFDAGYAYRPVRKDDPFVDHHSVIGNVFANVENMTSVSKIAEDIEFYNNVIVDVPGRILAGYGASNHFDFQCNAVIDGGEWSIDESVVHSDYNDFYNTPSFGGGANNRTHGAASDAEMGDLCFDRKIWTNRQQHCLAGARTTQASPHRGRCPSTLGSYGDVGVHDRESPSFFRPFVDAQQLNVSAEASTNSGPAPLEVFFTAAASNAEGAVDFSWDFDDGARATGASVDHTFDTAGTFDVTVEGTDASGQTDSASLQIEVGDGSDLRFAPEPYVGDFANWNPKTPARWRVTSFEGDRRLFLATSDYEADGELPGEYALVEGRRFSEFEMKFEYRTGESLQSNDFADAVVLFGWGDAQNFFFVVAHHQAEFAKLFRVDAGSRELVAKLNRSLLPDEEWHRMTVAIDGSRLRVSYDGTSLFDRTVSGLQEGQVGLGAFDESVYFDNVSVTASGDGGDVGDAASMTDTASSPDSGTIARDGADSAASSGATQSPSGSSSGCSSSGRSAPSRLFVLFGFALAAVVSLRRRHALGPRHDA